MEDVVLARTNQSNEQTRNVADKPELCSIPVHVPGVTGEPALRLRVAGNNGCLARAIACSDGKLIHSRGVEKHGTGHLCHAQATEAFSKAGRV